MLRYFRNWYYRVVPYEWRPRRVWYRIKCRWWHRYTTVKPRGLPHTWVDRCELLPHLMFEVLGQFIEKECSPGAIDWDADDFHRRIRREMQELWDWWNDVYLKQYSDSLPFDVIQNYLLAKPHELDTSSLRLRKIADLQIRQYHDRQCALQEELKERMKRLVDLHDFLWT